MPSYFVLVSNPAPVNSAFPIGLAITYLFYFATSPNVSQSSKENAFFKHDLILYSFFSMQFFTMRCHVFPAVIILDVTFIIASPSNSRYIIIDKYSFHCFLRQYHSSNYKNHFWHKASIVDSTPALVLQSLPSKMS